MSNDNTPTFNLPSDPGSDAAANLIRSKLDSIYAQEPNALDQAIESAREPVHERSKHQRFMAELAASGKPFASIQTEWHNYYQSLPDNEKHEVWNEFYSAQNDAKPIFASAEPVPIPSMTETASGVFSRSFNPEPLPKLSKPESVADLKKQITSRVRSRRKLSRKQHFKSLLFGLSAGAVTVLILLFGLFNERIIAPFITPNRNVGDTPLISVGGAVGSDPKLIIPKINLEVPVVYDVQTVDENAVQEGLERGVVHYATTSNPGEQGNGAIFGHSSNNILNKGKYKFAFVLLSRLEVDDTFYVEKDGVRYVYKIFDKKIVKPEEVAVLGDVPGRASTMALITCDPPGTTIHRLVVWGEQISPDPAANGASTALKTDNSPAVLAGNAESLWSRLWPF